MSSTRERAVLDGLLAALLPACMPRGIEVVVARDCSLEEYHDLERAWPRVLFMPGPQSATVRQLRAAGLSAAEGDIVDLITDDVPLDSGWLEDLTSGPAGGAPADADRG